MHRSSGSPVGGVDPSFGEYLWLLFWTGVVMFVFSLRVLTFQWGVEPLNRTFVIMFAVSIVMMGAALYVALGLCCAI